MYNKDRGGDTGKVLSEQFVLYNSNSVEDGEKGSIVSPTERQWLLLVVLFSFPRTW